MASLLPMKTMKGMEDELIQEVTEYNQITCLLVKKDAALWALCGTSPKRLEKNDVIQEMKETASLCVDFLKSMSFCVDFL